MEELFDVSYGHCAWKGMDIDMKKRVPLIIICVVLLSVIALTSVQYVFLWPMFYPNNSSLNKEENREIKSLLLNVMKDRHSTLFSMDKRKLYTKEFLEYMADDSGRGRSWFVSIDLNFMDSVKKVGDNEYKAGIKMELPEDWYYGFTIKVVDGKYLVSEFGIDP